MTEPLSGPQTLHADRHVGLFGGSFNPPHVAHQHVCAEALDRGGMDEVLLVPCLHHPFEKPLAPYEDRLAMCRRAARPFGKRVRVSEVERELGGLSRTVVTLEHLVSREPGARWSLIIGSDILAETGRWYAWDRIRELAELFVVDRTGAGESHHPTLDVSSTEIRAQLAQGKDVSKLVPAPVLEYIHEHGLYLGYRQW
ncbi:MAG: nicotinate (nicotinamide) nucleotide adenylyltransferase [bacterium]